MVDKNKLTNSNRNDFRVLREVERELSLVRRFYNLDNI